jgi:hypothetical protein
MVSLRRPGSPGGQPPEAKCVAGRRRPPPPTGFRSPRGPTGAVRARNGGGLRLGMPSAPGPEAGSGERGGRPLADGSEARGGPRQVRSLSLPRVASRTRQLDAAPVDHLAPFPRPASKARHPDAAGAHNLAPFPRPASRTRQLDAAPVDHLAPFAHPHPRASLAAQGQGSPRRSSPRLPSPFKVGQSGLKKGWCCRFPAGCGCAWRQSRWN